MQISTVNITGIAKYPAVTRDISMVVPKQVLAGQIEDMFLHREAERSWRAISCLISTKEARSKKDTSLWLILWYSVHHDKTLEESEITAAMKKILNGLDGPWNRVEKLMLLYIVRHGLTPWNHLHKAQGAADIPLAQEGIDLARKDRRGI